MAAFDGAAAGSGRQADNNRQPGHRNRAAGQRPAAIPPSTSPLSRLHGCAGRQHRRVHPSRIGLFGSTCDGCESHGVQPDGASSERHHRPHPPFRNSWPPRPADGSGDRRSARPRQHQRRTRVPHASDRQREQWLRRQPLYRGAGLGPAGRPTGKPGSSMDCDYLPGHRADDWSPSAQPGDTKKSWVNLALQTDPRTGTPRAWVNLEPSDADMTAWQEMENAAVALAQAVAGSAANIQNIAVNRNGIGTTHHEAGTLWMGSPGQSVTDSFGKFHHVSNAYVAGPALFPVIGSANPSLTATTLARRTADAIVTSHTVPASPTFKPLFTGSRQGWQMSGGGDFLTIFGSILEARPNGLGLLWYTREVFRNF